METKRKLVIGRKHAATSERCVTRPIVFGLFCRARDPVKKSAPRRFIYLAGPVRRGRSRRVKCGFRSSSRAPRPPDRRPDGNRIAEKTSLTKKKKKSYKQPRRSTTDGVIRALFILSFNGRPAKEKTFRQGPIALWRHLELSGERFCRGTPGLRSRLLLSDTSIRVFLRTDRSENRTVVITLPYSHDSSRNRLREFNITRHRTGRASIGFRLNRLINTTRPRRVIYKNGWSRAASSRARGVDYNSVNFIKFPM